MAIVATGVHNPVIIRSESLYCRFVIGIVSFVERKGVDINTKADDRTFTSVQYGYKTSQTAFRLLQNFFAGSLL